MNVPCTNCATILSVPANLLGQAVQCPRCAALVATPKGISATPQRVKVLPAFKLPAAPPESPPPPDLPPAGSKPATAAPRKRSKPKTSKSGLPGITIERGVLIPVVSLGVCAVVGVVLFFGLRAALRTPPPAVIPAAEWDTLEVPGRLKILMPGTARRTEQMAAGASMIMHLCERDKDSVYGVGYNDSAPPPDRLALPAEVLLNDSCEGALAFARDKGGRELSRESIQLGTYPGKELVIELPKGNGKMIMRAYLAHGRLIMALAGGRGFEPGQENLRRFFDSLEILDGGAPPAPKAPAPKPPAPRAPAPMPPNPRPPTPAPPPVVVRPRPRPAPAPPPVAAAKPPPFGAKAEITLPADAGPVMGLGYSSDGRTLAVATRAERVFWCDPDAPRPLTDTPSRPTGPGDLAGCAISPAADKVAFYKHGWLLYWLEREDPAAEVILQPSKPGGISQWQGAFSPDGKFLCTTHGDRIARVWDVAERKVAHEIKGFQDQVRSVAYTPDGSTLACADRDVLLFDTKTYQQSRKIPGPGPYAFSSLAFSPDGKTLAGANDRTVYVWNLAASAAAEGPTSGPRAIHHFGRVQSLTFSSDGRLLLSASDDGKIRLTDPQTLKRRGDLSSEDAGAPTCLAVRAKDGQLAVGCGNRVLFVNVSGR
jgi:hypothetical protein